jgi:hypothetical protein
VNVIAFPTQIAPARDRADGPFPGGKRFAFTIVDDTDHGNVANLAPVYELLERHGILTTKTVWVYPPRGTFTGECLEDAHYLAFIRQLQAAGFEIALHNVGDGYFSRDEIKAGLDRFRELLGHHPRMHINHSKNTDNLYWSWQRFSFPIRPVAHLIARLSSIGRDVWRGTRGSYERSPQFWGDLAKERIKYFRNLTFDEIDTYRIDPRMPYRVSDKDQFSNLWFSSSNGSNLPEMLRLLSPQNLDRLEKSGGVCIVYTHFGVGCVDGQGRVDARFRERIEDLASREGYFVPASDLLEFLSARNGSVDDPGIFYRLRLESKWLAEKLKQKFW